MKKKLPFQTILVTGIIVILSLGVISLLIFLRNQPPQTRGIPPMIAIDEQEPDSAKWGLNFPNQYSTLMKTKDNATRTKYGGSESFSKLEADSRLVRLFAGYSFAKSYNEERGHENSVTDVRNTPRINDKTPGTCYSCKSSDNPRLWSKMGMADFDKTPFAEMGKQINNPIGCANCHEANTMRLIVTNPALEEALKAQGKDWTKYTRQEMRSLVCANCHVEYYFAGEGKYLTFPWKDGTNIDEIEKYYDEVGFTDWTHPDDQAPLLKMQHPDFELYSAGSTHYKAGVACADCHMPYTREGAVKFSSHDVHSPLIDPAKSCAACHTDVEYVVSRAKTIQDQVATLMGQTEVAILAAVDTIKASAANPAADQGKLTEARELHKRAQMRWDFIAAESSMGFHNPEEALRILANATDFARQAQVKALEAVQK